MIVDPDFFDHWKTQMLCNALGDQNASLCVLRLWAFCHNRKSDTFEHMPAEGLKAVCRWHGEAEKLEAELCNARFIYRQGNAIVVHGWREKNKSLFTSWENGKRGGRPKAHENNPTQTHGYPTGNPQVTQNMNGFTREEKRRVEKSRPDKKPVASATVVIPVELDCDEFKAAWTRWVAFRIEIKHRMAKSTMESQLATLAKVGVRVAIDAIEKSIRNGWQGLFPESKPHGTSNDTNSQPNDPTALLDALNARQKEIAMWSEEDD